jgi:hypothetical protein
VWGCVQFFVSFFFRLSIPIGLPTVVCSSFIFKFLV